jgi:hypothetical protein
MRIVNNEFEKIWKEVTVTYLMLVPSNKMIVKN